MRRGSLTLVVGLTGVSVAACGSGSSGLGAASVPPEFRHACGHPGAQVHVRHVPVTIRHADCDLTGVGIIYRNYGGAYVSKVTGTTGTGSGFTLTVHPGTHDVTITAPKGPPGNA